jgi:hypothetical protein
LFYFAGKLAHRFKKEGVKVRLYSSSFPFYKLLDVERKVQLYVFLSHVAAGVQNLRCSLGFVHCCM